MSLVLLSGDENHTQKSPDLPLQAFTPYTDACSYFTSI
jgi:hypothetical protein